MQVIFGTATGGVEVWELKKEEADQKTSVYKVDSKYEHLDVVSGMELLKQSPNKIVTSDWNGCLKVILAFMFIQVVITSFDHLIFTGLGDGQHGPN